MTWDEIFGVIGPSLIEGDKYWSIPRVLVPVIEARAYPQLRRKWPRDRFQNFLIAAQDADAILLQLRALKLIASDKEGRWSLTPYGDNFMSKR